MQMANMLLPNLMIGDCTERVCVCVARLWELCKPDDEAKLLHTNMLLVDEEVKLSLLRFLISHVSITKQLYMSDVLAD
jgi:hypothetical protein